MPSSRRHITSVLEDDAARDFIHSGKASPPAIQEARGLEGQPAEQRRKISIRLPLRLDDMLSQVSSERIRASRQKKLTSGEPCEKQEIMAEALHEWLEKRGYIEKEQQ